VPRIFACTGRIVHSPMHALGTFVFLSGSISDFLSFLGLCLQISCLSTLGTKFLPFVSFLRPLGSSSDKSRGKRAYISWEDEETSSTRSDSENDEVAQLCLMGQKKKPLEVSDSDSYFNPSYNEKVSKYILI